SSGACAGTSWATSRTPRTPFRRRFWCWRAGPAPFTRPTRSAVGCTASLIASPKRHESWRPNDTSTSGGQRRRRLRPTLRWWDVGSGRETRRIEDGLGQIFRIAVSPNGKTLAAIQPWNTLHLRNAVTGEKINRSVQYDLGGNVVWEASASQPIGSVRLP